MKACPNDAFLAGNTVLGQYLESLGVELSANDAGDVAIYIPQLGLADPSDFLSRSRPPMAGSTRPARGIAR